MFRNFGASRIVPVITVGALLIVAVSIIYIGTQIPKDNTSAAVTHAQKPNETTSPVPEKPWIAYESEAMQISFQFPVKLNILQDAKNKFVLGDGSEEITFSTLESVPISKLHLCSLAKPTDPCIYDSYLEQKDPFVPLELDQKKAKSFYFRDENGHNWHVVSLSVYQEFQIMLPVKYDNYYDKFISSFDFWDNNEK